MIRWPWKKREPVVTITIPPISDALAHDIAAALARHLMSIEDGRARMAEEDA